MEVDTFIYRRTEKMELTTCGHVKIFSPTIVSTHGSSNAHCLANGNMADTDQIKDKNNHNQFIVVFWLKKKNHTCKPERKGTIKSNVENH